MNRAAALLARPGAWLEDSGGVYLLRATADRRRRPMMRLDEAALDALVRPRPGPASAGEGGYVLARTAVAEAPASTAARPGVIEGERMTAEADGRLVARRANLGESPIAWLARRCDPQGRPWLTPVQAAAGEKLREDFHRAGTLGRLAMAWDAGPAAAAVAALVSSPRNAPPPPRTASPGRWMLSVRA